MWEEWGKYAKKNGNYAVCKVMVQGVWQYELWQIKPQKLIQGHFASFEDAKNYFTGNKYAIN